MESVRAFFHSILVALSQVLDPGIRLLNDFGAAIQRYLLSINLPYAAVPIAYFGLWLLVILLLIRFLRGALRLLSLVVVALLLLRIYHVLPDI